MPAPVDSSDPFRALSDPKRRAILDLLAAGPLPVRAIAEHFPGISRPAVSKHLRMLRDGGLVEEERSGRERHYSIVREAVEGTLDWLRGVQGERPPRSSSTSSGRAGAGSGSRSAPAAASRPRPERSRLGSATARKRPRASDRVREEERTRVIAIEPEAENDDWKAW